MTLNVQRFFDRYDWAAVEVEEGIWQARFSSETDEEFDLFALVSNGWLRLAVTPLIPRPPTDERPRICQALLEANALLTGARFALDSEGDVALHGDLPAAHLSYAHFSALLDQMVGLVNEISANRGQWP